MSGCRFFKSHESHEILCSNGKERNSCTDFGVEAITTENRRVYIIFPWEGADYGAD